MTIWMTMLNSNIKEEGTLTEEEEKINQDKSHWRMILWMTSKEICL